MSAQHQEVVAEATEGPVPEPLAEQDPPHGQTCWPLWLAMTSEAMASHAPQSALVCPTPV